MTGTYIYKGNVSSLHLCSQCRSAVWVLKEKMSLFVITKQADLIKCRFRSEILNYFLENPLIFGKLRYHNDYQINNYFCRFELNVSSCCSMTSIKETKIQFELWSRNRRCLGIF